VVERLKKDTCSAIRAAIRTNDQVADQISSGSRSIHCGDDRRRCVPHWWLGLSAGLRLTFRRHLTAVPR